MKPSWDTLRTDLQTSSSHRVSLASQMLAKCGVHHYNGNNNDLGTACGKFFRVSCLTITDAGDSDIIKVMEESA